MISDKLQKLNKPAIGLGLGLVFPLITFLIMFAVNAIPSFSAYIQHLKNTHALLPVMSLCVLPNLILFFIFKKLNYWYAIKGVVISVFLYTVAVVVLKFA